MSDAVWYYAHGDEEKGPVTAAQLKSLAMAGKLAPQDLVWKEGMPDWTPAQEVKGLFPKDAPAAAPATTQAVTPPHTPAPASYAPSPASAPAPMFDTSTPAPRVSVTPQPRQSKGFEPLGFGRVLGQPLLLIGLFLVLFSRGCDNIGMRNLTRLNAKMSAEQSDPDSDRDDIEDLQEDIISARSTDALLGYMREWLFMFGSIALSIGLLSVGFTSEGAARWICLIMLAIITFSLYVAGTAWISSVVSQMGGAFR